MPPAAPLIVGARVYLRLVTAADGDELTELNRRSVELHHPWSAPPTTAEQFAAYLLRAQRPDTVGLMLCERASAAIIGCATLSQIFRSAFQNGYLGYYVGAPFAGQGLMTAALALTLDYAFGPLGLHRLEANIQPANAASLRLVGRLGLRYEGFSPRYLFIDGAWRDHERWAILAEDWAASRRPAHEPPPPPDLEPPPLA